MSELSPEKIIRKARDAMGISDSVNVQSWRVQRLDQDSAYFLVVFGGGKTAIAVAAIDAQTGAVQSSARLAGGGSPLSVDAEQAKTIAGLTTSVQTRLVWKPCRASLSPLYPLCELRTATETLYIDQQGNLWEELEPAGPGG